MEVTKKSTNSDRKIRNEVVSTRGSECRRPSEVSAVMKPWMRSRDSGSSKVKRYDALKLTVIKPVQTDLVDPFDYQLYRLRKKYHYFNGHLASNIDKFVKQP